MLSCRHLIISIKILSQQKLPVNFDKNNVKVATHGMLVYTCAEFIADLAMDIVWHLPNVIFVAINSIIFFIILLYLKKQWHFILQFLAVLNSVYYILATIVPFVMLVFAYPMWASSFLLMITVIFASVYIIISTMEHVQVQKYIDGFFLSVMLVNFICVFFCI